MWLIAINHLTAPGADWDKISGREISYTQGRSFGLNIGGVEVDMLPLKVYLFVCLLKCLFM